MYTYHFRVFTTASDMSKVMDALGFANLPKSTTQLFPIRLNKDHHPKSSTSYLNAKEMPLKLYQVNSHRFLDR